MCLMSVFALAPSRFRGTHGIVPIENEGRPPLPGILSVLVFIVPPSIPRSPEPLLARPSYYCTLPLGWQRERDPSTRVTWSQALNNF